MISRVVISRSDVKAFLGRYSVVLILVALCIPPAILAPRFLTVSNLTNVVQQSSILGIVAIGVTFTILAGGIDLSGGSLVAFCGALSAGWIVRTGMPVPAAVLLAVTVGAALGGVNGLSIVFGGVPPFVATLAMMAMARGATLIYTDGRPISGMGDAFTFLGTGRIGPLPVPVMIFAAVFLAAYVVLKHTVFGAHIYAVGGHAETARVSGVKVRLVTTSAYVVSGALAALGGVLLAARLWSAQPQAAIGLELSAIAAAVLGGASLMGGAGSVTGTLFGALIMGVVANGLNLMGVSSYIQQVITGTIFILAVMIDMAGKRGAIGDNI